VNKLNLINKSGYKKKQFDPRLDTCLIFCPIPYFSFQASGHTFFSNAFLAVSATYICHKNCYFKHDWWMFHEYRKFTEYV